jgi:two-component system, OmpR family, phosphate regulon sensor histidine kinase PhoR
MLLRIATFLIAACAASATFFIVLPSKFGPLGAVLGGLLWLLWDAWRAAQFDAALRAAQTGQELTSYSGWWGGKLDRVRRMLRNQQQLNVASEQRMTDFLAAIQASPNGVLLLDSQNRIEWCNQTAAQQLGLNAQRDVLQHIGNLVRQPDFARIVPPIGHLKYPCNCIPMAKAVS